jgi:hypothetical protein
MFSGELAIASRARAVLGWASGRKGRLCLKIFWHTPAGNAIAAPALQPTFRDSSMQRYWRMQSGDPKKIQLLLEAPQAPSNLLFPGVLAQSGFFGSLRTTKKRGFLSSC